MDRDPPSNVISDEEIVEKIREDIQDATVVIDAQTFLHLRFINCLFVYRGGTPPRMGYCIFENCEWRFEGPALNTIEYLGSMAHGGMKEYVVHGLLRIPPDEQ